MLKNKKVLIATIVTLLVAIGGGALAAVINSNNVTKSTETTASPDSTVISIEVENTSVPEVTEYYLDDEDWATTIMYDGKTYKLRDNITTVLFMGIDSDVDVEVNEIAGGGGRADTILLFILDEENKKIDILEISRDTMVDVDVYNFERDLLFTGNMQICMQYSFSDSSRRSCMLMKNKVSDLLYSTKIDNYCSLTVNGMVAIVEEMGGITITFDEDYSYINEAYVAGATVTLDGEAVNKFVRYRDTDEVGSNNERMERQAWFLKELFSQMSSSGSANLVNLYDAADNHLCTDLGVDELKELSSYSLGTITKAPGTSVQGEFHDEYYVDEEGLREVLISLLYEEI
ncbi:MAG: LCP family protein [Clostridia bacterium]|nr:LCP family protein [Clostridia bacterium]